MKENLCLVWDKQVLHEMRANYKSIGRNGQVEIKNSTELT